LGATAGASEFSFEIEGVTQGGIHTVDGLDSVIIDDIIFDYHEASAAEILAMVVGADFDDRRMAREALKNGYRVYRPGRPIYGNVTFKVSRDYAHTPEFSDWFKTVTDGLVKHRTCTVSSMNDQHEVASQIHLFGCWPKEYHPAAADGTAGPQLDEFVCGIGSISIDGEENPAAVKSPTFRVGIPDDNGVIVQEYSDDTWGGGELELIQPWPFRDAKFHTSAPGYKSVGEITLRTRGITKSKAFFKWAFNAANRKPWKSPLTITELLRVNGAVKDGKQYIYYDCFPTRVIFPDFNKDSSVVSGPTLNIKASRVNIN
jgi:hypothetical protein